MLTLGSGDGPLSVRGRPSTVKSAFTFPFGNGLRPPLTVEPLHPLRSETKGQAGACPDRIQAIPCKVRGTPADDSCTESARLAHSPIVIFRAARHWPVAPSGACLVV
jgi:hypothetical protein